MVHADHRTMGGDDFHFQTIDFFELARLASCRAGHATDLRIERHQVLHGNRAQHLPLLLEGYAFLGLDG